MSLLIIGINYNCAWIVNIISLQNIPLRFTAISKTVLKLQKIVKRHIADLDITNDREGTNNLEFNTYYVNLHILYV